MPFFTTSLSAQCGPVVTVAASLLVTPVWDRYHGVGRWLSLWDRDRPGAGELAEVC